MDILGLLPSFGGIIWTALFFVVALSVIVAVHEYGHYIVGRWCGIHAEVFSLGFGPVVYRRPDKRGTVWQIAALPLGGFVKFLGDADAASGKDGEAMTGLTDAERRRTMHGAPLWARAATVVAGPVFNFALSIVVFAIVLMVNGTAREPVTVDDLIPLPAQAQTLESGDQILAVGGTQTPSYEEFFAAVEELPVEEAISYTIVRDGTEMQINAPYPFPPLISAVQPGSAAMAADLQVGDVITAIDGAPVSAFKQLQAMVSASDGKVLLLDVWRPGAEAGQGEALKFSLAPRSVDLPLPEGGFETRWLIGMTGGLMFTPATESPGVVAAARYGVTQTIFIVKSSISGLYHMITGAISTCNLSGPLGIAETSGAAASQGVMAFVYFIAVLSTAVGMLNLFPIPVLDGGHLVFHAYEAVTGKPPGDKALRILMAIGLAVLLSLMAFALTNDIFCP
ncbi:RIP metalloprotease RseP [Alphaproteobacteria bacterium KMM 3653]|uniref:Zinc metalloprotease n=1 Tax=Harenicola maris TaxID=2841044 RepID=A0AAP2CM29_9RHOB|nr:RIP metalloprotease RseP [Harenicola maris]